MLREGGGDAAPFSRWLLEDGAGAAGPEAQQAKHAEGAMAALRLGPAVPAAAGGGGEGPTLVAFLEEVQRRAAAMLRPVD